MVFNYFHDPGHGWIKITRRKLQEFGIHKSISTCSYESWDGKDVFLEEDDDASKLFNVLKDKGISYTVRNHYSNKQSKIRNYPCYKPY